MLSRRRDARCAITANPNPKATMALSTSSAHQMAPSAMPNQFNQALTETGKLHLEKEKINRVPDASTK